MKKDKNGKKSDRKKRKIKIKTKRPKMEKKKKKKKKEKRNVCFVVFFCWYFNTISPLLD